MKTTIKLDANDIRNIIAEHYNVIPGNVTVRTERTTVGYGLAEHDEYLAVAKVEVQ